MSIHDSKKLVDANNTLFIEQSLGRATNVKNNLIKELQKQGYNAMYDNASIGVGSDGKYSKVQEGIEPLIIFDSKSTLKELSVRTIDETEQKRADDQYIQWKSERDKLLKKFQ